MRLEPPPRLVSHLQGLEWIEHLIMNVGRARPHIVTDFVASHCLVTIS